MGKTTRKILNMESQLAQLGVRIETMLKNKLNNQQLDTVGLEFSTALKDLDAQQNCNKYRWYNLPDYLPSWLIEYMLYIRGSLCGYISGGILYIYPYAQSKGISSYGLPNAVQPITFNGTATGGDPQGKELMVNNTGSFNKGAKACILYDRIPAFNPSSHVLSRASINQTIIEAQANILGRIKNNLRNVDKKAVFYVDNENQANQARQDLIDAYGTDLPFIIMVRNAGEDSRDKQQALQGDIANETQSLFEAFQSFNSIRCMISGITNGGAFEKKERKITGELEGSQTQTELVVDNGLFMRRLFIAQMQAVYPEYSDILGKIRVELNERTLEYEEEDTQNESNLETGGDDEQ